MTYKIMLFRQTSKPKVIQTGLSLVEAQEICSRPDTRGDTWFYGYTRE